MATPSRIALIDIGTNSIKLLIAEMSVPEGFRSLHFSHATTRLGSGLERLGRIDATRLENTLKGLTGFQSAIENHSCDRTFAFSTHVLRRAKNATDVLQAIEQQAGIRVEILTEEAEAYFAFLSAKNRLHLDKPHAVLLDIGGGSTELAYARNGRVEVTQSLPLGALQLTERFLRSDPIKPAEYDALEQYIDSTIHRSIRLPQILGIDRTEVDLLVSGGAASTLGRMIARVGETDHPLSPPSHIERADLEAFLNKCLSLPLSERKSIPGLEPDRADIIVAGFAVILTFLSKLDKQSLYINEGGVREGVLLALIRNGFQWPVESDSTGNSREEAPRE